MSSTASVAAYVPPARQSRFQRNLKAAVADGRLSCGIEAHNRVHHWVDQATQRRFTDVERKPLRELYDNMMPDQVAKCPCLKQACEAQWNRNFHLAYTTTAIAPGSYKKGIDAGSSIPKKVYSLRCSPKPDKMKFLISRFPEWYFVVLTPKAHDHPVAHTSTKIIGGRMLDELRRGTAADPLVYVDLYGNPGANESYMARNPGILIITIVEAITPKDYIRKMVKWGPEFNAQGVPRWYNYHIRDLALHMPAFMTAHKISGFLSIHTIYYFDKTEIVRLLAAYQCPLHAAQHRFQGASGSLNDGEQTWVKRERASTTEIFQTNVTTGAVYDHPDNSFWFEHDSMTSDEDGVAWDANLLCDETYIFLIVHCPRVQCEMSTKCLTHKGVIKGQHVDRNPSRMAQTQDQIALENEVRVTLCGVDTKAPIETHHVAFFGKMRKTAIGKKRTSLQLADHITRCKIAAASMEKSGFEIDAQQLDDIANMSFMIDYSDQLGADAIMFGNNFAGVITSDSLYSSTGTCVLRRTGNILMKMVIAAVDASTPTKMLVSSARAGIAEFNTKR